MADEQPLEHKLEILAFRVVMRYLNSSVTVLKVQRDTPELLHEIVGDVVIPVEGENLANLIAYHEIALMLLLAAHDALNTVEAVPTGEDEAPSPPPQQSPSAVAAPDVSTPDSRHESPE